MPLPFIVGAVAAKVVLGATVATGAVGAAKGLKGAIDTNEAKDVQYRAEKILKKAQKELDIKRENTSKEIKNLGERKLKASANEINDFVKLFTKINNIKLEDSLGLEELEYLNLKETSLGEMKDVALEATDILASGIAGAGAGALLGWGAYGGVMALGTAGTGTAIGGLAGIAATNSTLAWLGGGALYAGGGGMALGSAVLGGIVAGPALLLAGGVFGAKAKEKLNNAYSNLSEARKISEELKTAGIELDIINKKASQFNLTLEKLVKQFNYTIKRMEILVNRETKWEKYTRHEQELVAMAYKYAQIVKEMIDIPLLTQDGLLTSEIRNLLDNKTKKEEIMDLEGKVKKYLPSQDEKIELEKKNKEEKSLTNEKINLNLASKKELKGLPNIGEVTANNIIEYRQGKKLEKLDDLIKIKGIGKKTLEELRPLTRVK